MKAKWNAMLTGAVLCASMVCVAEEVPDVSDEVLLELYDGARVTDVVDGLVTVG